MDIFSITSMLGGLAFFLYGMRLMSDSLEKSYGGSLNKNLKTVTNNRLLAILFGAGITIAVQSSSAVTVMLVGLVNSGIIEFGDTIGVMMGSNIGTTLTAWILSLAGLEGDIWWINILKPANFTPILAFIGILLTMIGKRQKTKNIGHVLLGFSVLMFGMTVMADSMEPLSEMPEFRNMLTAFKNPILSVLVGTVFTGIIQSSAASVAILQAFSISGGITYGMAIPIIVGLNIGTCVTALISSIGVSKNAKKVAVTHLLIKIIGAFLFLIPFYVLNAIFNWAFVDSEITPFMIALIHSIFNIATTIVLLPFTKQIEKLTNRLVPGGDKSDGFRIVLDDRLLAMPSVAVERSLETVIDMSELAKQSFLDSIDLLFTYDQRKADKVMEMESQIDKYQDYLVLFSAGNRNTSIISEDNSTISSAATAKNVVTVGASENYRPEYTGTYGLIYGAPSVSVFYDDKIAYPANDVQQGMMMFSSRGPAKDGRAKPDICAPGTMVQSTESIYDSVNNGTRNSYYTMMSGTSMSTPLTAGACADICQFLLERGFESPSASLMKAVLINGTRTMGYGQYKNKAEIPNKSPNCVNGFGHVNLMESVSPAVGELFLFEDSIENTDDEITYVFSRVSTNAVSVTLCWNDPAGSVGAAVSLVNDLDLTLNDGEKTYLPNALRSGTDTVNVIEKFHADFFPDGDYIEVKVRGGNVMRGPQSFALAVSGMDDVVPEPSLMISLLLIALLLGRRTK